MKSKKLTTFRNIAYVFGILLSLFQIFSIINAVAQIVELGETALYINFVQAKLIEYVGDYIASSIDVSLFSTLVSIVEVILVVSISILNVAASVLAMAYNDDPDHPQHSGATVAGAFSINPFTLLAGFLNHRVLIREYKIYPQND